MSIQQLVKIRKPTPGKAGYLWCHVEPEPMQGNHRLEGNGPLQRLCLGLWDMEALKPRREA